MADAQQAADAEMAAADASAERGKAANRRRDTPAAKPRKRP